MSEINYLRSKQCFSSGHESGKCSLQNAVVDNESNLDSKSSLKSFFCDLSATRLPFYVLSVPFRLFLSGSSVIYYRKLAVTDNWEAMLKRTTVACALETVPPADQSEARRCPTSHLKNVGTHIQKHILLCWFCFWSIALFVDLRDI